MGFAKFRLEEKAIRILGGFLSEKGARIRNAYAFDDLLCVVCMLMLVFSRDSGVLVFGRYVLICSFKYLQKRYD